MFENEKPIQKDKLHDQVFERLCTLLREGEFTPGKAVPVSQVSRAFGVSAMPVREALTRLVAIGVLTNVSGRSVGVPQVTREELADLRNVRLELESTAANWAVRNRSPAFLRDLEVILDDMLEAEANCDEKSFIKSNYEFHFRLYQQAQSPILLEIIDTLWLRVSPHLYFAGGAKRHRMSNENHRAIIDAVRAGDSDAACAALVTDISGAYDDLVQALFKRAAV